MIFPVDATEVIRRTLTNVCLVPVCAFLVDQEGLQVVQLRSIKSLHVVVVRAHTPEKALAVAIAQWVQHHTKTPAGFDELRLARQLTN